jgi:ProP effector
MSAGRKAEAIKAVSALFPKAFGPRQPLKYKIHEDLLSAGVEHKVAAAALSSHCNNPRYLMSMVEGATRVDLQGQPAGVVTAEEAARAQQRLAERRLKQKPEAEKPKEPEKPVKPKPKAPLQASPKTKKGRNASTKPVVVEIRRQPNSRPKRTFNV